MIRTPFTLVMIGLFSVIGIGATQRTAAQPLPPPFEPDEALIALDGAIDWTTFGLMAVQDQGRYKSLESFARETMGMLTGRSALPGLSPCASALEWAFNSPKYEHLRVVYLKDAVMRREFAIDLPKERRAQAERDGLFTPAELRSPAVQDRIGELRAITRMQSAVSRVLDAIQVAHFYPFMLQAIPAAEGAAEDAWHAPRAALWNLPPEAVAELGLDRAALERLTRRTGPIPGLSSEDALAWARLAAAWNDRDAAAVNAHLSVLARRMPEIAGTGHYPPAAQLGAERVYYRMNKFASGWIVYLLAAIVGAIAMVTRWKTPAVAGVVLLLVALAWHATGIGLRWYILGRIPVANMFEATFAAAWMCVLGALLLAWVYRHAAMLVAAAVTGFFALILADFVMPAHSTNLGTMMAILDDVMLRIHTTLIVLSYAMVFLAAVLGAMYLFGFYLLRAPAASVEAGVLIAACGLAMSTIAPTVFTLAASSPVTAAEMLKLPGVAYAAAALAALLFSAIPSLRLFRAPRIACTFAVVFGAGSLTLAVLPHGYFVGWAKTAIYGGAAWTLATLIGAALLSLLSARTAVLAPASGGSGGARVSLYDRPILAGALPGDEQGASRLPRWLHELDWCHLIVLNIIFVALFVGTILGAIWADYSWGRPWGWDPKEVFAMNTWIVYAAIIHIRFVVRDRGLWTAWLSLVGCAVMAFNWYVVNTHIVGLHSYA
ncbi:MAG: cytochrome c biogenesis protein CcsA [Planctomycetia bacterium]|nr:MAG: cytochrome c biogenesis protein CcsA [Planctomycetia bacterium]